MGFGAAVDQAQRRGPGIIGDQVQIAQGVQARRRVRERIPPGLFVGQVVFRRGRILVGDDGEGVQHTERGQHVGRAILGEVGVEDGERTVLFEHFFVEDFQQRRRRQYQLARAAPAVRTGQRERAQPVARRAGSHAQQADHHRRQRPDVQSGQCVFDAALDRVPQLWRFEEIGGLGALGTEAFQQGVRGIGVHDPQASTVHFG